MQKSFMQNKRPLNIQTYSEYLGNPTCPKLSFSSVGYAETMAYTLFFFISLTFFCSQPRPRFLENGWIFVLDDWLLSRGFF